MDEKELHVRPRDFPYLYPNSLADARRLGETQQYDDSFHLNVDCARAIEQAIRDHFDEDTEVLKEGCAQSVLERFGFKRTNFVLANSLKEMGSPHLVSDEVRQWGQKTFVPSDGRYNRYFAADTAAGLLESFIGQAREAYQALNLFGPEHCAGDRYKQDFTGKVLVMSLDTLREACWDAHDQLWLAEGGFGCSPDSRGRAVYATCLSDGEKTRWNRADFLGVLDEKFLPDWAMEKLEELRGPQQEQDGPAMGGMTLG